MMRTFISYCNDTKESADRVLSLAKRLRADGISAVLDQYEISPAEGWQLWMERQIEESDFTLLVCTRSYFEHFNGSQNLDKLGVKWEANLIRQHIYDAGTINTRFIPVLVETSSRDDIPIPLRSVTFYDLASEDGYAALYRHLTQHLPAPRAAVGRGTPPRDQARLWRERPEEALTLLRWHAQLREVRGDIDVLNPLCRALPIIGRDEEFADLQAWLNDRQPVTARCLIGRAGTGKTRLAIELCAWAEERGWYAGFVEADELVRFRQRHHLSRWRWRVSMLVVVDHASASVRVLREWLRQLVHNPGVEGLPLRLLLLDRHAETASGWWSEMVTSTGWADDGLAGLFRPPEPISIASITNHEDRRALLSAVMTKVCALRGTEVVELPAPGVCGQFDDALASTSLEREPLYLLMAGIGVVDAGGLPVLNLSRRDLATQLAGFEIGRLRAVAEAEGVDARTLDCLAAIVTLMGGCSEEQAADLLDDTGSAPESWAKASELTQVLKAVLPLEQGGGLSPIRPDLIGEAAVLRLLGTMPAPTRDKVLSRAWRSAAGGTLSTLIRVAQDFAESDDHVALACLERLVAKADDAVLVEISDQLPEHSMVLGKVACTIQGKVVEALRARCTVQPSENALLALAHGLRRLSDRLANVDRLEDGLLAADEAVRIHRELACSPAVQPRWDFALALGTLANRRSALGRRSTALTHAEEAIRMLGAFPANSFTRRRDVGGLLADFACHLSNVGRRSEALGAAQRSLELHRELFEEEPQTTESSLALTLLNYGFFLSDVGKHDEALAVVTEALDRLRGLVAIRPDSHVQALAQALQARSVHLAAVGRADLALEAAEEAVVTQTRIAVTGEFTSSISMATMLLTLSGQHLRAGRLTQARQAVDEAVARLRALGACRPGAYLTEILKALNNQAIVLRACGERSTALRSAEESVATARVLARQRPDRCGPDLAASLLTLAELLYESDGDAQREHALELAREAVSIRRSFAERWPEVFRHAFVHTLQSVAAAEAECGHAEQAERLTREAAGLGQHENG